MNGYQSWAWLIRRRVCGASEMPLPAAFCMRQCLKPTVPTGSGLLGLLIEPYLLEGIFEQCLPGHVDLYVTGECVGLKTNTVASRELGRTLHKKRTER